MAKTIPNPSVSCGESVAEPTPCNTAADAERPAPLKPQDKVAIVATSGPFDKAKLDIGLEVLRNFGLEPVVHPRIFDREDFLAGTDASRELGLRKALEADDIAAVWLARGGYGAARLLPEFAPAFAAGRRRRWFVGFSDGTAIHALWQHRLDWASIHAANITGLASWCSEAQASLRDLLFGDGSFWRLSGEIFGELEAPSTSGPVVGGNLTVLASMAGTGWLPKTTGAWVFLEDVGEPPYRIDRVLEQLHQAGFFNGCLGVLLGQFSRCGQRDDEEGVAVAHAVATRLKEWGHAGLWKLPVGHATKAWPLPLGQPVQICRNGIQGELRLVSSDFEGV